ncbi:DNA methyltransferase [Bacteroides pyogenes]|uniref:DNA methyltransferase n=1 Tax=Bacteroides pyogenes TaxID=310300 RepID=UPI0040648993
MNSDRLLIDNVNNGIQWFRKFFAVDFRIARLVSNNQPMTRVDLIAEFCKGKTRFNNLRDGFSTLIECAKIHNDNEKINFGHKQAKRVDLPGNFIAHYSDPGNLIVDLFAGSGSTIVAALQLGRKCYAQEYAPSNCQIIIDRLKKTFKDIEIKAI